MSEYLSTKSKMSEAECPDPIAGLRRVQADYETAEAAFRAQKREMLEQAVGFISTLVLGHRLVSGEDFELFDIDYPIEEYVDILLHALTFVRYEVRCGDCRLPDDALIEKISKESKRSRLRAGSPRDE